MEVLLLAGLGALFFTYYWADNIDPATLQGARVLLTGASASVGEELAYHYARLGSHLVLTAHAEAFLHKVGGNCRNLGAPKAVFIAADVASHEVPELVVQLALDKLGRLPTSFSGPYSAAKFALDSFVGSLKPELLVQDVNVAIASAKEGVRSSMSLPVLLPELLHLLREDLSSSRLKVGTNTFEKVAMTQDSIINTGKENRKTISTWKQ